MEVIKSRSNETVKMLKKLDQKKYRQELGLFLVEGHKMLKDCIKAGFEIVLVAISESKVQEYAEFLNISKTVVLQDGVFDSVSDTVSPQGIIAVVLQKKATLALPSGDSLILDNINDAGNVGTMIRTAAAAGISDIYLINCADPYSPKTIRSTMGGIFFTRIYEIEYDFLDQIKKNSVILGADMIGTDFRNYKRSGGFISLAIGSEANGLSEQVRQKCSQFLSIPMKNTESLNAAISAGILMYYLRSKEL